jgi:hypothetical protein
VREADDGAVQVEFMDPAAMQKLSQSPALGAIAGEVRERLLRVMNAL